MSRPIARPPFPLAYLALVLSALAAPPAAPPAAAQQQQEQTGAMRLQQAKTFFIQGQKAFQQGRLREALDKFHKANKLVPSAELAYNIGHIYDRLGEPEQAIRFLRLYLSRSRESISDRKQVEQRIALLREKLRRTRERLITAPPHLTAEARAFFQRGTKMFKQARYREALAAFVAAQRLVRAPEITYNLALTSEKLGRKNDAIDYYRAYSRSLRDPGEKQSIEKKIHELQTGPKDR